MDDAKAFLGSSDYTFIQDEPKTESKLASDCKIVYCDGGCDANGTPRAVGGIGVYYGKDHPRNISMKVVLPSPTNNRCELYAAIMALAGFDETDTGLIRTDSQYTINKFKAETCTVEEVNFDLIRQLHIQRKLHPNVKMEYVKAHCGIEGNEGADLLTKVARHQSPKCQRSPSPLETPQ